MSRGGARERPDSFDFKSEAALNNAFQVTDIIKEELIDANRDLDHLRQKLVQQTLLNQKLKHENLHLKDRVHQYRKIVVQ